MTDGPVGARARDAIVHLGGESAGEALKGLLDAGSPEARLHALVGLAALPLPSTGDAIPAFPEDAVTAAVLRAYAVHALASVQRRECVSRLRSILHAEVDPFVRETAVRELASFGDRMGLVLLAYLEKRPSALAVASPAGFPFLGPS